MKESFERYEPDMRTLPQGFQTDPCFVCQIVSTNSRFPAHVIYKDEKSIAFLDKYARQYGCTLVAPKRHLEQVIGDFGLERYPELQRLIFSISEAVRTEVSAERIYIFTFGSIKEMPMSFGTLHLYLLEHPTKSNKEPR